jgi:hypothetical protein
VIRRWLSLAREDCDLSAGAQPRVRKRARSPRRKPAHVNMEAVALC